MQSKNTLFILMMIIIPMFLSTNTFSQNVTEPDSIIIIKKSGNDLLFEYRVDKGNTVYGISKFFKVDIMQIYGYNPQLQIHPLDIGSKILIPFNKKLLSNPEHSSSNKIIKVFYKVGVRENLFRIARIYFDKQIAELRIKNHLKDNIISPGQLLYIGNVYSGNFNPVKDAEKKKIIKEKSKQEESNIVEEEAIDSDLHREKPVFVKKIEFVDKDTSENKIIDSTEVVVKELVLEDNGLAIWNKNLNVKGIFVLNNDAKLYSLMELYNPLVNKKIIAKVIGRIPDNTYPDNVKIILSPDAAKSLRAIDQRFFVRFKYLK